MPHSPTSEPESAFVCDCEERMREACAGEPFYRELEGKRYCVLHLPGKEKSADFEQALQRKLENEDFDFRGVWFPDEVSFDGFDFSRETYFSRVGGPVYCSNATFSAKADFSNATFGSEADFSGATFGAAANFGKATFNGAANFSNATFNAKADFSNATFNAKVNFSNATFSWSAIFMSTFFNAEAMFSSTIFSKQMTFAGATFSAWAYFSRATFTRGDFLSTTFKLAADFSYITFSEWVTFTHATFSAKTDFAGATFSGYADFSNTNFSAEASFAGATFSAEAGFARATFSAEADFSAANFTAKAYFFSATFGAAAIFSRATFADANFTYAIFSAGAYFNQAIFGNYVEFAGNQDRQPFGKSSSLDLQFATIEKSDRVSFHTLTLHPHWFINVDARKFDFTNVDWGRPGINAELTFLKIKSISSPQRLLAIACRHLAVNAEENHRYEEASKFRYMSMDARRLKWKLRGKFFNSHWKAIKKTLNRLARCMRRNGKVLARTRRRLKRFVIVYCTGFDFLHWIYWVASGYGERIMRGFTVLIVFWVLFAGVYTRVGFARSEPKSASESDAAIAKRFDASESLPFKRALAYSLGVMMLQRPEPKPATTAAQTLVLLETILGPVQAALLALAIRRKFMR